VNEPSGSKTTLKPINQADEIVIPFWPYSGATNLINKPGSTYESQIKKTVFTYGAIWLALAIWTLFSTVHYSGGYLYVNFCKYILLALIPLFALTRGFTHMRLNSWGIYFEKQLPGVMGSPHVIPWLAISEISLLKTQGSNPRRYTLCFKDKRNNQSYKLKLSKIATSEHWKMLLAAIAAWSPVSPTELDESLFDSSSNAAKDLTYTSLWLEALSAPPQRARLIPLSEGCTLKQGSYILAHTLGSGGQGTAYLATRPDGSKVVLKEYILPVYVDLKARRQAVERFQNEAMMLSRLDHPLIVKLLDSFVDDHRAYLVLEFIDGISLKTLVAEQGPIESRQSAKLGLMMCDVLTYLHGRIPPVVHRDFTPDNLILSKDGSLKLIDFMIAQQVEETSTATIVGKHCYLSPEQFRGKSSTASDIYGLGASLSYLLTGSDPEPITTSHPIIQNELVDPIMDQIVAKCTEIDLAARYNNALAVKKDLERFLEAEPGELLSLDQS
jgi:tRNA A-37 threonylcarbamoyl transferase component Bud32